MSKQGYTPEITVVANMVGSPTMVVEGLRIDVKIRDDNGLWHPATLRPYDHDEAPRLRAEIERLRETLDEVLQRSTEKCIVEIAALGLGVADEPSFGSPEVKAVTVCGVMLPADQFVPRWGDDESNIEEAPNDDKVKPDGWTDYDESQTLVDYFTRSTILRVIDEEIARTGFMSDDPWLRERVLRSLRARFEEAPND